jgi:hypothetical protein
MGFAFGITCQQIPTNTKSDEARADAADGLQMPRPGGVVFDVPAKLSMARVCVSFEQTLDLFENRRARHGRPLVLNEIAQVHARG